MSTRNEARAAAIATAAVLRVTVTAAWFPARRAQRTDPLDVLRTN